MKRSVGVSVFLFLAAFLGAAGVVRKAVPFSEDGRLASRMAHLETHADEYDLLFLGSSHVERSFDPRSFEDELARRGRPLRAFNLGVEGMLDLEADYLLRRVLSLRPQRLRFVLIELLEVRHEAMLEANPYSDRVVDWHTSRETFEALGFVLRAPIPWPERAATARLHLAHAARRAVSLGQGPSIAAALFGASARAQGADDALAARGGFEALEDAVGPKYTRWRLGFLANLPRYRAEVARHEAQLDEAGAPDPQLARFLAAQAATIRAAGAEPVYVIPPTLQPTARFHRLARAALVPNLLAFDRPSEFPELYDERERFDGPHLGRRGAERFSRLLAERVAALPDRDDRRP